jgi:RNA polymerase sigma-70 factor (ECF subfamily)
MEFSNEHIKKFNEGNLRIFEQIHKDMYDSLCLYGEKIIPETDTVEDVVHEAFIALWDKRKELDNIFRVKAYLYTIVRNKLLTHKRLKKTVPLEHTQIEVEDNELDLQVLKEETFKILRDAISTLPERTQLVLQYKMNGYTNNEIAAELDISINTVKTLQRAGYSKLREKLKENAFVLLILAELLS